MEASSSVPQQDRLKFFPIMMFAIVMGMCGVTIMYQKASEWLSFPHIISSGLIVVTTIIFVTVSIFYISKLMRYPTAVRNEFAHPVRINFFAAISISLLMLAIIYKEHYPAIAALFWYPGTIIHFYLTLHTISFWINHNQEIDLSNPAWFIPIVGNVLVPIAGVGFVSQGILMYFFSVGIFFWIILFAILLNRIIFHNKMATKFLPTLFILIAPPAVGFIAYIKMFESFDLFANILFSLALFFTFLMGFMYKNFIKIKFFISWWAFIFPLAAMTISTMLMHHHTKANALLVFSYVMIAITTIIAFIVIYQTILHINKREICIQE